MRTFEQMKFQKLALRGVYSIALFAVLAGCERFLDFDLDLRPQSTGADTSEAVRVLVAERPQPDNRGVLSYPGYQVIVAQRGETVSDIATRIGVDSRELARYNGLPATVPLRSGEIIALPGRVAEPSPATGAIATGPIRPAQDDIAAIAGNAIERADGAAALAPTGEEPLRHQVQSGETAFSIARLYGVPANALADWNGLDDDLTLRPGQFLLIPPVSPIQEAEIAAPGEGSLAPNPPSSIRPLPRPETLAPVAAAPEPQSPDLSETQTDASDQARLRLPVAGNIIRPYDGEENKGIGIAANAGDEVGAAADGEVALVSRDELGNPIIVIKHDDNLLTVYFRIDEVSVERGDPVRRGQTIARVANKSPIYLHFEVREGLNSVDPTPYLR